LQADRSAVQVLTGLDGIRAGKTVEEIVYAPVLLDDDNDVLDGAAGQRSIT
jgi:hypothetical protein